MRICVYGAGAVGGHLAAKLAAAGNDVSVVARGPNLSAIRERGIKLLHGDTPILGKVTASDDPSRLGPQDFVIVTLKANALSSVAENIHFLLKSDTAVVFAQNGIPWWYALGLSKDRPAPPDLSRLDPGQKMRAAVKPEQVIGAVIYSANELVEPGVVQNHTPGRNMLTIGEPGDEETSRIKKLREVLKRADMHSPQCADIRQALWSKLLLNLGTSTLCLLSEGTVADVRGDPLLVKINERINAEGRAIAQAHGINPAGAPERPGGGHGSGKILHKPSMIQDYDLGRPMEVESQLATPLAFGRAAGVATPTLDALIGLVAYRAAVKGLYTA
jgi:2-dehydropantoate 2-reductase